jgi:hypothetical protein
VAFLDRNVEGHQKSQDGEAPPDGVDLPFWGERVPDRAGASEAFWRYSVGVAWHEVLREVFDGRLAVDVVDAPDAIELFFGPLFDWRLRAE